MRNINEPFTKEELLAAFREINKEVEDFFSSITTEKFYVKPNPDAWSARDNLDHLNKSVGPVGKAMTLPKLVPSVLFGKAKKPSRRFDEIRETYLGKLKEGAKATGRFVPDEIEMPKDTEKGKQELLDKWKKVSGRLLDALSDKWSEKDLDTYTLPHPVLGKLTVREMLFFTLYHDTHHINNVRRILE